jgi:hypothetical protein
MQIHDQGGEEFELPSQRAISDAYDFFSPTDKGLGLAKSCGERTRNALFAIALITSFGLGWAGGQMWPEMVSAFGPSPVAQKEVPSPRLAKTVQAARHAGASKPSLAVALQEPPNAKKATLDHGPTISSTIAAAVARVSLETTGTVSPVTQSSNIGTPGSAALGSLAPAPETKPSTIPGWTVIDVRDGTAVLDGPYGPRMARLGDSFAGIGRVDSIVRWGNRWIVATSDGLIASH